MNLLYLHAHDLGRWISPHGFPVETPALAKFLEQPGTRLFSRAHSAAPTCSPSRAALLTGMTPHETGMLGLMHRGFRLTRPERHLASLLQSRGWATTLAGIQHLQPGADLTGYDRRFNPVKPVTQQGQVDWQKWDLEVADAAVRLIEGGAGSQRPFFLDCGFWLPHRPFPVPDPDIRMDGVALPAGVADTPATRADLAGFLTAVRHFDHCAGRVLAALDSSGPVEETLVVITTDHGPAFPGYKCRLTDGGTGVTLMIRPPSGTGESGPNRIDALVSQLDLLPTVCDYLRLDRPDWPLRGTSLRPLMEGETVMERDAIFSEVTYHAAYEPMRAVRTQDHVLIRHFDEDLSPVPANVDDSAAKDAWLAGGALNRVRDRVELYDCREDPAETRNVAEDPGFSAIRSDLESRLDRWMEETEDPLRFGPVPLPVGGYANARHDLSATIGES